MRAIGNTPPSLPRGELEDLGAFCVWWYTQGKMGSRDFARRWAYALRDGEVWLTGSCVSNFASRDEAVRAAGAAVVVSAAPSPAPADPEVVRLRAALAEACEMVRVGHDPKRLAELECIASSADDDRVADLESELRKLQTCDTCEAPATRHVCRHHCFRE